ncbi:Uncharacterized protein ChrSV_1188 [Chromobacterium vaccinii]|jgi:hypothetical protein|nr:Uncharacterized protein ChrSW_1188 [Chromobacterium vaccinii]QND88646.1 Uncharacterized protein ChrSV_1188 [Chromobacterium vaccinii]
MLNLNATITAPSGREMSLLDALTSASMALHDTDADCARVCAARAHLDAVLAHIEQTPRIKARVSLSRLDDGRLVLERFGDAEELAGVFQTVERAPALTN